MGAGRWLSRTVERVIVGIALGAQLVAAVPALASSPAGPTTATPTLVATANPTPTPIRPTGPATASPTSVATRPTNGSRAVAPAVGPAGPSSPVTPGTELRSFTAQGSWPGGRAMAFDGTNLWYTYDDWNVSGQTYLYEANTSGTLLKSLNMGVGIGALAWDAKRGLLWGGYYAYTNPPTSPPLGNIYQINPSTGAPTLQFTYNYTDTACPGFYANGLIDGLAY
ncbi:MAG: hypothetical protein ACRDIY_16465, partial [Chloroflexota bacterium]